MKIIHKYLIQPSFKAQTIDVPGGWTGASFRFAGMQGDAMYIWVEVCPEAPVAPIEVLVVPTGMPFDDEEGWNFIQTVPTKNNVQIFHVFARKVI